MASHTRALMRKWSRYGECGTCAALPGDPCRRKIPINWNYRGNDTILVNPHKGRPKSAERCNDDGGMQLRTHSTFACCLVPDHGGEVHRNWYGKEWPVKQETEVMA